MWIASPSSPWTLTASGCGWSTRRASSTLSYAALADYLTTDYGDDVTVLELGPDGLLLSARGAASAFLALLQHSPASVPLDEVQPAHEITASLASGAMSHGALVATAHEAVAHGTNMVGGAVQLRRGRRAPHPGRDDPRLPDQAVRLRPLRDLGRLPGRPDARRSWRSRSVRAPNPARVASCPRPKVTVDIAAARGGTPGIELISPPPHHDTYSIEDLAQLIHDCKAARVRVIVKLVSSEGIGTIAVGVAKAGADVINVAGNTGGTGAAAVTSLKYAGRSAEIGVAEVHQALSVNGLRDKVVLRCSGAHQTGGDVVVSALLGGDSFEFGTTALMMLKCVMAKNCNIKCPAGLTTNPEVFDGDPRALAQYLLNIAHDVREILAKLGLRSLAEARGRTDLLQLLDHPASVGELDVRAMLTQVPVRTVDDPVYLEADFAARRRACSSRSRRALFEARESSVAIDGIGPAQPPQVRRRAAVGRPRADCSTTRRRLRRPLPRPGAARCSPTTGGAGSWPRARSGDEHGDGRASRTAPSATTVSSSATPARPTTGSPSPSAAAGSSCGPPAAAAPSPAATC